MPTYRTRLERLEAQAAARRPHEAEGPTWGEFFQSLSEEEVEQYADLCQRAREGGLGGIPKVLAGEDGPAFLARVRDYLFAHLEGGRVQV